MLAAPIWQQEFLISASVCLGDSLQEIRTQRAPKSKKNTSAAKKIGFVAFFERPSEDIFFLRFFFQSRLFFLVNRDDFYQARAFSEDVQAKLKRKTIEIENFKRD